ncbi:MAG: hypothetical protein AAGF87_16605 [Bacteroidota bacterium]
MPIGTTYLAGSADTVQNYADTYVSFTTKLITDTFEALLQAHHSQIQAYAELVGTLSKGLTAYINETKNEVSPVEILQFLSSLPLEQAGLLEPGQYIEYSNPDDNSNEPQLVLMKDSEGPEESATEVDDGLQKLVKKIFSPVDTAGNLIKSLVNGVKNIFSEPVRTNQIPVEEYNTYTELVKGYESGGTPPASPQTLFLELIKQTISYNKYGLLENMVETGLMRLVVDKGLITTEFVMQMSESHSNSDQYKYKNRIKTNEKDRSVNVSRFGIAKIFGRRNREVSRRKQKTLTVTTSNRSQSNNTSGFAQMKARVEIHFSTDYKPLNTQD